MTVLQIIVPCRHTISLSILRSQEENSFDHYICVLLDVCMRMEVGVAYILVFCWFSCFVLLLIFIELFVGLFWVFFFCPQQFHKKFSFPKYKQTIMLNLNHHDPDRAVTTDEWINVVNALALMNVVTLSRKLNNAFI